MNKDKRYGIPPFAPPAGWASKASISHLMKDGGLVGIKVVTDKKAHTIPVADVRVNRDRVNRITKAANITRGSKFFGPSYSGMGYSYNLSMKRN